MKKNTPSFQAIAAKLEALQESQAKNMEELREDIKELRSSVSEIMAYVNRVKGAFVFALMLGGSLGWFISAWEKIKQFFHG